MPQDNTREAPEDPGDLYEERGVVPLSLPLMQGDVFRDLNWLGETAPPLSMIVQHPCTMRKGASLLERLTVVAVESRPPLSMKDWQGFGHLMPLPDLVAGGYWAADFRVTGSVPSDSIDRRCRIGTLSNLGVNILQQRLTHYMTRFTIDVRTLAVTFEGVAAEMELQYEWVDAALEASGNPDDLDLVLVEEQAFQDFLGAGGNAERRLKLKDALNRPDLRKEVRREIAKRFATS